ncbi:unnamed protein product [Rotaria sordida]|uniref:G-protein coupled receptors family 1 profile domain-containing protein n=1 Tax=Rotaria sordida TaxID=392033 RepID=A0A815Y3Z5_9BILA|nr:unnamed protein product [Rotaria sordida]CAF1565533.1 unnamed protein product [Rotaria sordida]
MEMNNSKMMILNETITRKSSSTHNIYIISAGHLLIVFYCIIFILGFLGNSAVIYVAIRKKKYRNVTNCYVINLALADLLFLTLAIPYTTYLGLVNTYPFGKTICKIYIYLVYVFLLATCNTLAVMSIDRYLYITLPTSKLQHRSPQTAFIVCILIWTSSLVLIIPYHIVSRMFTSNSNTCGLNDHKSFTICFLVFCSYYALPLFIIIVCYTKLAMHVIRSNRLIAIRMNTKTISKSLKTKQKQVTRMVIIVTLAFAVCWLPIHILELMKCANSSILYALIQSYPVVLYSIRVFTHALAYFNSCLNPYLYALLNRNFCVDLMDIIPLRFIRHSRMRILETNTSNLKEKFLSPTVIPNESSLKRELNNNDVAAHGIDYNEKPKSKTVDVCRQIELHEM